MSGARVDPVGDGSAEAGPRSNEVTRAGRRPALLHEWSRPAITVAVAYAVVLSVAIAPAVYWGVSQLEVDAFRSPDETTAYLAATTFAAEGRLYLEDAVTAGAPETPTGPRGFIQHEGRAVPFYPLGHLFLLGVVYAISGSLAPLALAAMPAALFLSLVLTLRAISPGASPFIGLALFGVVPLWFFVSRVHIDVASATTLLAVAVLCFTYALKQRSIAWLTGATTALGLAALVRHQEAVFLVLLGTTFLVVFLRQSGYALPATRRVLLIAVAVPVAVFVVPLLVLNWLTYGSPLTVGYVLFYREAFPDRMPGEDAGAIGRLAGLVATAVVSGPVDLEVLLKSLWYRVVLLIPVPLALAVLAVVRNRVELRRVLGWEGIALLSLTAGYVLVSRASPGTFLAVPDGVTFAGSIVRYWLPVYLLTGLASVYALAQMPRDVALALSVLLLVSGAYHVWLSDPQQSVLPSQESLNVAAERHDAFLAEHTEPDALVFAGGFTDKFVTRTRRTAGVMRSSQRPVSETMRRVADNAAAVSSGAGLPVYFLFGAEDEIAALQAQLSARELHAEVIARAPWDGRWTLFELQPSAQRLVPNDGLAEFVVPAERFVISVEHDGSSTNLVANPSFEDGLDGWSGPDVGDHVRLTTAVARFGERSLVMEMRGNTDQVRRTWHVDLNEHPIDPPLWSARAWVLLEQHSGAEAVLRTWVKGTDGSTLARYSATHAEAGDAFVPIVFEGGSLPAGAARIEIQVAVAPVEGAIDPFAVVYWDGVEVVPGGSLPVEYCDGDHHGCRWSGTPHASKSSRLTPIEALIIEEPGGQPLAIPGPIRTGDQLVVDAGGIELVREGEPPQRIEHDLSLSPGASLSVRLLTDGIPALRVAEED